MAKHKISLGTLKDCLQFLEWLHRDTNMQGQVATVLHGRIKNYYKSKNTENDIKRSLNHFLTNVSAFYTRLCYYATSGTYTTVTAQQIMDALTEGIPKFLAALYYLWYCINNTFGTLGGGGWENNWLGYDANTYYGGDLGTYLHEKSISNNYGGLIPGGFSYGDVRYGNGWSGYRQGYNMAKDLENILKKDANKYNYFRDILATSVFSDAGVHNVNTGNAVALVGTFCQIVMEEKTDGGGQLKAKLDDGLRKQMISSDKFICWKDLQSHCAHLKKQFGKLFTSKRVSHTGQSTNTRHLISKEFASKTADWLRTTLTALRGRLTGIDTSDSAFQRHGGHLGAYFTQNLFPYGFIFDDDRYRISTMDVEALKTNWRDAIDLFKKTDDGFDMLRDILYGTYRKSCPQLSPPNPQPPLPPPPPPLPPSQTAEPVLAKAEAAKPTATKIESPGDQGKKAEGAQNQGKKAEGAQNQGKKSEGTPDQGNGATAAQSPSSPVKQAVQTQNPSAPSSDPASPGTPGPTSGQEHDGQTGAVDASQPSVQTAQAGRDETSTAAADASSDPGSGTSGKKDMDEELTKQLEVNAARRDNSIKNRRDDMHHIMEKVQEQIWNAQKASFAQNNTKSEQKLRKTSRDVIKLETSNLAGDFNSRETHLAIHPPVPPVLTPSNHNGNRRAYYEPGDIRPGQAEVGIHDYDPMHLVDVDGKAVKDKPDIKQQRQNEQGAMFHNALKISHNLQSERNRDEVKQQQEATKQTEKISKAKWEKQKEHGERLKKHDEAAHKMQKIVQDGKIQLERKQLEEQRRVDAQRRQQEAYERWIQLQEKAYNDYANSFDGSPIADPEDSVLDGAIVPEESYIKLHNQTGVVALHQKAYETSQLLQAQRNSEEHQRLLEKDKYDSMLHDAELTKLDPLIFDGGAIPEFDDPKLFHVDGSVLGGLEGDVFDDGSDHGRQQHTARIHFGENEIHDMYKQKEHDAMLYAIEQQIEERKKEESDYRDFVNGVESTGFNGEEPFDVEELVVEPTGLKVIEPYDDEDAFTVFDEVHHPNSFDLPKYSQIFDKADPESDTVAYLNTSKETSENLSMSMGQNHADSAFAAVNFNVIPFKGVTREGYIPQCRNPWYISTSITQTPLSLPPATDHLPPPKTVREMLYWFVGLNQYGLVGRIADHVENLFKDFKGDAIDVTGCPITLTASNVTNTLTEACLYAATVIDRIRHHDNHTAYKDFKFDSVYSQLHYASDSACLLCQLRDYVYACCHQLEFLKAQCNRDSTYGGWQNCNYGSDITSSKSPLQAFLTDGWDSTFETHPFDPCNLCLKSRIKMKFKRGDLPKTSQQGSVISAILTPSCGGSDPLLTLSSYLNCLTRRTPRTTGELMSFFHHFGNSLHDAYSNTLLSLGESLASPHAECPDWDHLKNSDLQAVKGIRGTESINSISNHNHDNEHPRTLSTLVGCGSDSSNCPQHCSPITYRAYALYSQSFAHTYLSWTVYLPDRLRESLEKLYYDLKKHKCSSDKSLHQCSTALPLLYSHGFTPPEGKSQAPLTCQQVIDKLQEIVAGKPIADLISAMDNFLYGIREPFIFSLVALWSLAFCIFANTMLYRLDMLRIRSHLTRSRGSHVIDVKALLTDGTKMPSLYDIDYFDEDTLVQLVVQ